MKEWQDYKARVSNGVIERGRELSVEGCWSCHWSRVPHRMAMHNLRSLTRLQACKHHFSVMDG